MPLTIKYTSKPCVTQIDTNIVLWVGQFGPGVRFPCEGAGSNGARAFASLELDRLYLFFLRRTDDVMFFEPTFAPVPSDRALLARVRHALANGAPTPPLAATTHSAQRTYDI